jgi:hypothetical protein
MNPHRLPRLAVLARRKSKIQFNGVGGLRTYISFVGVGVQRIISGSSPRVEQLGKSRFRILRCLGLAYRFICASRRPGGGNAKYANYDRSQRGAEMLPR